MSPPQNPTAKLYGVGVGPGAPDLMTLRAVNILRTVDVVAIPRKSEYDRSLAWRTAEPNLGEIAGQERLFLTFPMTKDPTLLGPAWEIAFAAIGERLSLGKSVAFLCQGDPLLYSTFGYLLEHASERWPTLPIEVVPAVSSITAVPAALGRTIADGSERIAILPATYGIDDLRRILQEFDTVFLMKVGSVMNDVIEALEAEDLIEKAAYVSKATTAEEKVVLDLASLKNDRCDYFSMVMISKRARKGVLTRA